MRNIGVMEGYKGGECNGEMEKEERLENRKGVFV